jgi:hypothetical protein
MWHAIKTSMDGSKPPEILQSADSVNEIVTWFVERMGMTDSHVMRAYMDVRPVMRIDIDRVWLVKQD